MDKMIDKVREVVEDMCGDYYCGCDDACNQEKIDRIMVLVDQRIFLAKADGFGYGMESCRKTYIAEILAENERLKRCFDNSNLLGASIFIKSENDIKKLENTKNELVGVLKEIQELSRTSEKELVQLRLFRLINSVEYLLEDK